MADRTASTGSPELSTSTLAPLFDMADELKARGGDDAAVKLIDVQSPMDIAALIWDKGTFYMALIEEPEAVRELAAKAGELLTAFLDEWFGRYGREFVAHYPDYYMPGGITLSEDEIGAVNEAMFDELFLPELVALSERYGQIAIHCCAHARHQWDGLLRVPNLRLLNLVQEEDVLRDAYKFFATKTTQMHSWPGTGDAWTFPEMYPADSRVVITVWSDEEARSAWNAPPSGRPGGQRRYSDLARDHDDALHLVIDSMGLKVFGDGEWQVHKHKTSNKRRRWRKLHPHPT